MNAKLIADSGSTKTDWRLLDEEGKIVPFLTQGLNPYFMSAPQLVSVFRDELQKGLMHGLTPQNLDIHFYGAGCGTDENCTLVSSALAEVFTGAHIRVYSDILGAAHALCGKEEGLVGILGTGMNTCYYDGQTITLQRASLGFILGDEGSGAYLGKKLIADLLNGDVPEEIRLRFDHRFHLSLPEILQKTYRDQYPNRFLASFSKFIFQNINNPYCSDLAANVFREFFDKHIMRYPNWNEKRFFCTGSVAFWFSNILRTVAEEKGILLGRIVESPIAGLSIYYLENP
jgi:glucosamine kinase